MEPIFNGCNGNMDHFSSKLVIRVVRFDGECTSSGNLFDLFPYNGWVEAL